MNNKGSRGLLIYMVLVVIVVGIAVGVFARKYVIGNGLPTDDGVKHDTPVSGGTTTAKAETVSGGVVNVTTSTPVAITTSTPVPTATEKPKVVKYSPTKVEKALKKKSYISVRQILQTKYFNGDKSEGESTQSENFSIEYDTRSKISKLSMTLDFGTGLGNGNVKVINDFKNNKHYVKENDGKWERNKKNTVVLNLNHKSIKSAYDVYSQLLKDYIPKKGKRGTVEDGLEVYKTTSKAKKSDVSGCQYDKLLNKDIIVTLKKNLPLSVSKVVNFEFGGRGYQITTTIDIKELSNKRLKISGINKKKR